MTACDLFCLNASNKIANKMEFSLSQQPQEIKMKF